MVSNHLLFVFGKIVAPKVEVMTTRTSLTFHPACKVAFLAISHKNRLKFLSSSKRRENPEIARIRIQKVLEEREELRDPSDFIIESRAN
jgi:hypothetical protein